MKGLYHGAVDYIRKSWRVLLFSVTIPIIGLVVFPLVRSDQQTDWRIAVRHSSPEISDAELNRAALPLLCANPETAAKVGSPCSDQARLHALTVISAVVLFASILLPCAIYFAGRRCNRNRRLLLRIFRPGLYVVDCGTALIVIAQAFLLIAALYYGPAQFLHQIPTGLILATGVGALVGSLGIIRAMFEMSHEITTSVIGRFALRSEEPQLWKMVDEVARAAETAAPDNVIVGLDPTFFVTQTAVKSSDGTKPGRTLYLSAPLCRLLSRDELRAIIAHEMGHFKGEDTAFSLKFYPIYRGAANAIAMLAAASGSNNRGSLALLPAIHIMAYFLNSFAEAEASISRDRELAADRVASESFGARSFGLGLAKCEIHAPAWAALLNTNWQAMAKAAAANEGDAIRVNASRLFVRLARERLAASSWEDLTTGLAAEGMSHPTDSHPPLAVRLQAVGVDLESLRADLLDAEPSDAAGNEIAGLDDRELRLTAEMRSLIRCEAAGRNLTFAQLPD
jgi:Zn-dependent protease with chaperone function